MELTSVDTNHTVIFALKTPHLTLHLRFGVLIWDIIKYTREFNESLATKTSFKCPLDKHVDLVYDAADDKIRIEFRSWIQGHCVEFDHNPENVDIINKMLNDMCNNLKLHLDGTKDELSKKAWDEAFKNWSSEKNSEPEKNSE